MNLTHALVLLGVLLTPMLITASFQLAKKTVKMIDAKQQQSKIRSLICEVTHGIVLKKKFLPPKKTTGVAIEVLSPNSKPVVRKKGWSFDGGNTSFIILNKQPVVSFVYSGAKKSFSIKKILDKYFFQDEKGVITHLDEETSIEAGKLLVEADEFARKSDVHFIRARRESRLYKSVAVELRS